MSDVAFLFPGQGSQFVGMGRALWDSSPAARGVFDAADEVMGEPLSKILFEGPEEALRQTRITQPAILAHSLAALAVLDAEGVRPAIVGGHSLGEFTALVSAGALTARSAMEVVKVRADLMYRAGLERPGAMAAILGLPEDEVAQVCRELEGAGVVVPANLNAPGQVVVSGEVAAVLEAMKLASARGAKRAVRLPVSGAFHSPLMREAADGLAAAIDRAGYRDAAVPVVVNVSAEPLSRAADLAAASKAQLSAAVRWEASVRRMIEEGVAAFVEVGPGKVLRGLLKKIAGKFPCANLDSAEDLPAVMRFIREGGGPDGDAE